MKIYYVSDLHLEINGAVPITSAFDVEDAADSVLVIAGDTTVTDYFRKSRTDAQARKGRAKFALLMEKANKFSKVIMILGNHEHYNGFHDASYDLLAKQVREHCSRVHILENSFVKLDENTYLYGCTLWTNMRQNDPHTHLIVRHGMNDFRIIKKADGIFTTHDAYKIHTESVSKIHSFAQELEDKNIVVVTHHCPSYQSNGKEHVDSIIIDGYCSDLSELILSNPNITHWVHGHTHVNVDYMIGGCRVLANQFGYHNGWFADSTAKEFLNKKSLPYFEV